MSSEFFKKSDRDRHMKSKHDVSVLVCLKCEKRFFEKKSFYEHERKCSNCAESDGAAGASSCGKKVGLRSASADERYFSL